MHIFKYSPRKGTKAATLPNQVDGEIKNNRSDILISLSDENEKEFASKYIGKEIEVLFENETEGHTTNYIKVESEIYFIYRQYYFSWVVFFFFLFVFSLFGSTLRNEWDLKFPTRD